MFTPRPLEAACPSSASSSFFLPSASMTALVSVSLQVPPLDNSTRLQQHANERERYQRTASRLMKLQAVLLERQRGTISFQGYSFKTHLAQQRKRLRWLLPTGSSDFLLLGYYRLAINGILRLGKHQRTTMGKFFWLVLPLWPAALLLTMPLVPLLLLLYCAASLLYSAAVMILLGLCSELLYTSLSFLTLNHSAYLAHKAVHGLADVANAVNARDVANILSCSSLDFDTYYRLMVRAHYHNFFVGVALYQGLLIVLVQYEVVAFRGSGIEWWAQACLPLVAVLTVLGLPGGARCAVVTINSGPPPVQSFIATFSLFNVYEQGKRKQLDDVLREFVARESQAGVENTKFSSAPLVSGKPIEAALGINNSLGLSIKELWARLGCGLEEIVREFESSGTEDDRKCLHYVLHEKAGTNLTQWPHSGGLIMDVFYTPESADERSGQTLEYFVEHAKAKKAKLILEHVLALRLYTTAAYRSINAPLRAGELHPFPVTVGYLADGIKRLRAVNADEEDAQQPRDFWRGMRNLEIPSTFEEDGGTELAPMSTTSDLAVALQYSNKAEVRLLFKVHTTSFIDRGADLQFLSAFPGEVEFVYPPLTYLKPTRDDGGRIQKDSMQFGTISYCVIEVQPYMAA